MFWVSKIKNTPLQKFFEIFLKGGGFNLPKDKEMIERYLKILESHSEPIACDNSLKKFSPIIQMKWVGGWTCNSYWSYSKKAFELRIPFMNQIYIKGIRIDAMTKQIVITGDLWQNYNIPVEYKNGSDSCQTKSRPTGDGDTSE